MFWGAMMNVNKKTLFIAISAVLSFTVAANDYVNDDKEPGGWHFYVDPSKADPPPPPPPPPAPKQSPNTDISSDPNKPMSSAWLRENFPKFVDYAIDNPSDENTQRVRFIHRVMMDKASTFRDSWVKDVMENPILNETGREQTEFGRMAKNESRRVGEDKALAEIATKAGVWFFYRSDCPYCKKQAPLLSRIENERGIDVSAISLDGGPLPNGYFQNFVIDRKGVAKKLGVMRVPAMFLVSMDGKDIIPIAEGLQSFSSLKELMILQAKNNGYITEDTFNDASSVETIPRASDIKDIDPVRSLNDSDYLNNIIRQKLFDQQKELY
ncbi:hypothetical protein CTM88_20090 [Photobacterium aquimaris]|uniref:Conjugal transfer protein TraF n=2 Tax=Photobacterium aquimaris TaxID=512643 RepID=A0A2T3IEM8_9GAMM|nr:hypothetical protein CTM88_20090 [Photobacterium aquimaris]